LRLTLRRGQWLPSSAPKISNIALIDSTTKIILGDNKIKYTFESNDTSRSQKVSVVLRPRENVELTAWSFTEEIPPTFNNTYFVAISNGIEKGPLHFEVTLKTDGPTSEPLLDLIIVSIQYDKKNDYTDAFRKILRRVPDWAFAIDCVASVTGYTF